jgi:hypothetical protein
MKKWMPCSGKYSITPWKCKVRFLHVRLDRAQQRASRLYRQTLLFGIIYTDFFFVIRYILVALFVIHHELSIMNHPS